MGVSTERFIRKPLYVDAVRVTASNFDEIAAWCQGEIQTDEVPGTGTTKKYIKVRVHNPKNPRQTKAFIGDWLLYTERGYKVYTNKAFRNAFDLVEGVAPKVETELPTRLGNVSSTPEEKDQRAVRELDAPLSEDEEQELASAEEIREKLPHVQDRRTQVQKAEEIQEQTPPETALYTGNEPVSEELKQDPAEEQTKQIKDVTLDSISVVAEEPDPTGTGVQPIQEVRPGDDLGTTPQGEPIEVVEATPQAIADVVNAQQPVQDGRIDSDAMVEAATQPETVSEQPPEDAAAGKRVLSEEEQRQMGPDAVREMVRSGDVILAQDLAA